MKVKLDENLPLCLVELLAGRGHEVDTVVQEGLAGRTDRQVAEAARREGRMIVTADRGFPALAAHPEGHPGVIVLKLADQSVPRVEAALLGLLDAHPLQELVGSTVIVMAARIRIRRPEEQIAEE